MMTRNLSFTLLLALGAAATGCAAAPVGSGDDGVGSGSDPDPGAVPLTPQGQFSITSDFDLATNAPGTAGKVVNYFISATDDPEDPTKFLVDELIKQLPEGTIKNTITNSAPFVTGYLNDRLLEIAPNFVGKIIDVGDAFGQVTKHFGTVEVLDVDSSGHTVLTVKGLHFKIDNVDQDFAFADFQIPETKLDNVMITLEQSGKITISDHKVGLKYGQILRIALDQAIIPLIDPSARNLGELLHNVVNCQAVGAKVFEALKIGSASTFESACNTGLTAAGGAVYLLMDTVDTTAPSALEFGLTGTARGVDRDDDGRMDEITAGTWEGTLGYAGMPGPLGTATFFGKKM
ncbi:MAG: hypothetical protein H6Q90_5469 [Deltaproteobacteria bacterium]|nr:hypothetical protein [Deltaproteobacteria bacterium]